MTYCHEFNQALPSNDSNDPRIILRENKSSVSALNVARNQIFIFQPDKFFTDKTACDYLLLNCMSINCWFIELKGTDLNKAYRQITETIQHTWQYLTKTKKANAIIVVTKVSVPDYKNTPAYLKLKKELDKRFKDKNAIKVISRTTNIQLN